MTSEQTADAAELLHAKVLLPAHVGRFAMGVHPWDGRLKRIAAASEERSFRLVTPRIGEPIWIDDAIRGYTRWSVSVD
ncbi:L-ascorbate metabolism protein UlaG (beta-lactamase superfamily) [Paraburkholderia sp. JPY465]|uniref:hypothetical protein n=1 Tax=Paraburkholderia sp. JPY465 TaxID=3042285 RepID=UPI003D21DF22